MKPPSAKLQHQQQEETVAAQKLAQQATARGFASVEEMLRFDAARTHVPETVKTRLTGSIRKEPKPRKSGRWW